MKAGPLPDLAMGKADAPVTIVEYASMTCSHCASFHNTVCPVLKEKYIDTGKVRLIFREFPLDERAALASMMARCAGGDKALPLISMLFSKQDEWAAVEERLPAQALQVRPAGGLHQADVRRSAARTRSSSRTSLPFATRANTSFGVSQTPTFFINGKKMDGGSIEDFDKALAPLIKG